ncbi:hypothetical protein HID58_018884 [Brassica napus]|uniref:Uncharacterized protein n=1 Tax=Brassica napus TaxID=3708 RepID=A0ABQ8DBN5_BRANA|nr:hypothetical protein HID58_018884 [Brassica napus]
MQCSRDKDKNCVRRRITQEGSFRVHFSHSESRNRNLTHWPDLRSCGADCARRWKQDPTKTDSFVVYMCLSETKTLNVGEKQKQAGKMKVAYILAHLKSDRLRMLVATKFLPF